MSPLAPQLAVRLAVLGPAMVILQVAAVSQVELFGTNADISPLGHLHEMRDPQGALVPLAVGAAATLVATAGYSIMQFLLGADAPMSFALVREILATVLLNTILAGLVHAIVRRWLLPALPEDPRRRRRRAYTTGGLSPLSRA